ncbi:hypothetical protein GCM10027415_15410 [Humibacter ginsengisoli]
MATDRMTLATEVIVELSIQSPMGWLWKTLAKTLKSTRVGHKAKPDPSASPPGLIAVTKTQ